MGAKRRRNDSSNASGAGFALLVIIALIVKFFWWIVGALALVALFFVLRAIAREHRKRRAAYAQDGTQLSARADQQHNWVLHGDDRGVYGAEGARLMRIIERTAGASDAGDGSAPEPGIPGWTNQGLGGRVAAWNSPARSRRR